ncbi:MAG: hypothetical protein A2W95_08190 [Bacteroidetes bacterium GWA2_40_14]|nr:MAG: hypothetical protein A2W95_08190 [Bacteroidetes bacterium GWA2_40_14]
MKVKCIKTSLAKSNNYIVNNKMDEYLLVGSLFWVFGMRFLKGIVYIYIFNSEHLFEVPIELFEVVDNKLSNEWRVKICNNDEITLWPDLFYKEGFIENFAERESYERELFESLRIEIEK